MTAQVPGKVHCSNTQLVRKAPFSQKIAFSLIPCHVPTKSLVKEFTLVFCIELPRFLESPKNIPFRHNVEIVGLYGFVDPRW